MGIPSWVVLLAAFNEDLTGIPWMAGFTMATLLAVVITVVADRVAFRRDGRRRLGSFGRAIILWSVVFALLALIMSARSDSGLALLAVPFLGASGVTLLVEGGRRALGGHR